jgi:hypothetical protein
MIIPGRTRKTVGQWIHVIVFWILIVAGYLLLRFFISGEITGEYGQRAVYLAEKEKILNAGKVIGRLFLPPSEHSREMVIISILVFIFIILLHTILIHRKIIKGAVARNYFRLLIMLALSLAIPIAFGVSTRTQEGDRLLYFPSCFFCILLGFWIMQMSYLPVRALSFISLSVYFIFFLWKNNQQWVKASNAARSVLQVVKNAGTTPIALINVPDELEGAFVFRNGFYKALILNKVDTSTVTVINYLKRLDYLHIKGDIRPERSGHLEFIPPFTQATEIPGDSIVLCDTAHDNICITIRKDRNLVYYWNKQELVKLY